MDECSNIMEQMTTENQFIVTFFLWASLSYSTSGYLCWNAVIHLWDQDKEFAVITSVILIIGRREGLDEGEKFVCLNTNQLKPDTVSPVFNFSC